MRLFRSSNKSQASLDRHTEAHDQSPIQPESAYSQTQPFGGAQLTTQPPQQHQGQTDERYYTESQSQPHPTHVLNRSQSSRIPSGSGDVYAQDQSIVNVVPPPSSAVQISQATHISGPAPLVQPQPVRADREPKKSKRSIFGLGSSKREEKDYTADRRSVGRAPSVLKKGSQQLLPQSPQSPQDPNSSHFTPGPATARLNPYHQETTNEIPPGDTKESYEQFYRPQNQFDSPPPSSNPNTRQTVRYVEDAPSFDELPPTPRHQQQPSPQALRTVYQVYHPPDSADSSSNHLPLQPQHYDNHQALRPPSQASLGPPSPLVVQQPDSRPPTSSTQSRFSVPIVVQPQPQQDQNHQRQTSQEQTEAMGRNDNSNGNARQHREDDRHAHYQSQAQQDPRVRTQGHDQGRNTPPPRNRDDLASLDFAQLLQKHEELQQKYSKVKRYYFEREAQVTQLQNTVATQRLSMSKTTLDDAQYMQRFERLNGAIQNLSFNIRKDWRRVPNWLAPVCNRDAHAVGTKEMTAVGRACITRWLYESLYERVFHPGIDPNLSFHLKNIERNLRRSSYGTLLTSEQQDDLLTKITTWRLTTIEGLSDILGSRQSDSHTDNLINTLTRQLNDYTRSFLVEPPPPGLADNLHTIIIQAVGIASNIPLESRDICIEYFMPAAPINETYMRLETGMTALQAPGSAPSASDSFQDEDEKSTSSSLADAQTVSQTDLEAQIREASVKGTSTNPSAAGGVSIRNDSVTSTLTGKSQDSKPLLSSQPSTREQKKSSFLGGFVSKKPAPPMISNPLAPSIEPLPSNIKISNDAGGEYNLRFRLLSHSPLSLPQCCWGGHPGL